MSGIPSEMIWRLGIPTRGVRRLPKHTEGSYGGSRLSRARRGCSTRALRGYGRGGGRYLTEEERMQRAQARQQSSILDNLMGMFTGGSMPSINATKILNMY